MENLHLAGRDIDLGKIHELVGIDAGRITPSRGPQRSYS